MCAYHLFDEKFYLAQNADVRAAGVDAYAHYQQQGRIEGRMPNPYFDTNFYLQRYEDVARAGVDPLEHYFYQGWKEGRDPGPLFNTEYYLAQNPDVAQANLNPLLHFMNQGESEMRDPNVFFDTSLYVEQRPDVVAAGISPLQHFVNQGWKEGSNPSRLFDTDYYLLTNPDVARAGVNPLIHWLYNGIKELRDPSSKINIRSLVDADELFSAAIDANLASHAVERLIAVLDPVSGHVSVSSPSQNAAPKLEDTNDVTMLENTVNAGAQVIDADVTFLDGGGLANGFLKLTYSSGGSAEDTLSIQNVGGGGGQIGFDGTNISFEGLVIGTVDGTDNGAAGNDLLITFNNDANDLAVESLIENLTYQNDSDSPAASRTLELMVNDGTVDGIPAEIVITVTAENDAPTLDNALVDQTGDVTNSFSYSFAANSFGDAEGDALTYTVTAGLPSWATFNAGTRTLSGTPAVGDAAISNVTIRATDGSGDFVEDSFQIAISANIAGSTGSDTLVGSAQDEVFLASSGVDSISAAGGDDTITLSDWDAISLPSAVSSADLKLWLDATTLDLSDGANANSWDDQSTQNNDASIAFGQPTFVGNGVNGLPMVSFSSAEMTLSSTVLTGNSGRTIFIVSNPDNNNNGELFRLAHDDAGAGTTYTITPEAGVRIASGNKLFNESPTIGTASILTVKNASGATIEDVAAYIDGTELTKLSSGNGATVINTGNTLPRFGHAGADIAEIIVYDKELSQSEQHAVERYLSNKYGLTVDASVDNNNDTIDGGSGTDTLTISSGQFLLNPGTLSSFNSIEVFNLSGNDAAHQIFLTNDYYDSNGGVEGDVVTVNLIGNSTGSKIDASSLTGTHAISVQGSDGSDSVTGGGAADTLEGANASDILTGGGGNDIFIFNASSGQDIITDFENPGAVAGDVIHILSDVNGSGITDWTTLSANISQNGADTVIDLDPSSPGTHIITLTGTTAADFTADDFVFL